MAVKYRDIWWNEPAVRVTEVINTNKITAGKLRKVYTLNIPMDTQLIKLVYRFVS